MVPVRATAGTGAGVGTVSALRILLAVGMTVVGLLTVATEAPAHHFFTTCDERGIWTQTNSGRAGNLARRMEGWFTVNNIPQDRNGCGFATQHSAAYATRWSSAGFQCIETVAQRFNSGLIRMHGYDCDVGFDRPYYTQDIWNYGSPWIYLVVDNTNEDYRWDHWYYRADTGTWHLVDYTPTATKGFTPWIESSGYNDGATRTMATEAYNVTNIGGTGGRDHTPCPETNDNDAHQEDTGGFQNGQNFFGAEANNIC